MSIIIKNSVAMSQKQCISIALTNQLLLFRKVTGGLLSESHKVHEYAVCVHMHAQNESFLKFKQVVHIIMTVPYGVNT